MRQSVLIIELPDIPDATIHHILCFLETLTSSFESHYCTKLKTYYQEHPDDENEDGW